MLETRHKSGDRNGLGGGTQREDESVGQRPGRIRCAKCQWRPSRNGPWQCRCGLVWNTFDTPAASPAGAGVRAQDREALPPNVNSESCSISSMLNASLNHRRGQRIAASFLFGRAALSALILRAPQGCVAARTSINLGLHAPLPPSLSTERAQLRSSASFCGASRLFARRCSGEASHVCACVTQLLNTASPHAASTISE